MSRVVLIGSAIGYSASPAMHNAAFAALGLDHRYELLDVSTEALPAAVDELRDAGFLGANVTKPHKVAACALADERSSSAARLGAANTLVRNGDRLVAHNTDLAAFAEELAQLAPEPNGPAVVLGAGGAARAVTAALADAGWTDIHLVDRARWEALPALLQAAGLLVNATPVGTADDASPIPAACHRPDLAVLDLVYRPSPTRLVADARAAGARAVGGAGMLLRQAVAGFRLWTGLEPPVEAMRRALRHELGPRADV